MLDIYGTLEISKVLEEIASFSRSEVAKARILNLKMLLKEQLPYDLEILDEMMSYLLRYRDISLSSSSDLKPFIDEALKDGVLSTSDLSKIASDIESTTKLFKQFGRVDKVKYLNLNALANKFSDLSPLQKKINSAILPNLEVSDDASPSLVSIRRQIKKREDERVFSSCI